MTIKNGRDVSKKQDRKKIMRKQHLTKVIQQIGINGILYPRGLGTKHYYTQEIMILAEQQGLAQSEVAKILGVSQPMISQWLNGEPVGLADIGALQPLISLLTPRLPGDKFEVVSHVTKITKSIPSNWEEEMIIGHCQRILDKEYKSEYGEQLPHEYRKLTKQILNNSHLNAVNNKFEKMKKECADIYNKEEMKLEESQLKFKELISNHEFEVQENKEKLNVNKLAREKNREELTSIGGFDERQITALLNKNNPMLDLSNIAEQNLTSEAERLKEELSLKNNVSSEEILLEFDRKIKDMNLELENKYNSIDNQHNTEVDKHKIFDVFKPENVEKELIIPSLDQVKPKELYDIADKLYGNEVRTINITVRERWGDNFSCNITLNFKDMYIEYISKLLSNYHYEISSGHICYSEKFELSILNKTPIKNLLQKTLVDETLQGFKDIQLSIYKLYSNDLLLKISASRATYSLSRYNRMEYSEGEVTKLNFIHRHNTADNCISHIENFLSDCNFNSDEIESDISVATDFLFKSGYRFNSISAIY